jgi:hypothetical protein
VLPITGSHPYDSLSSGLPQSYRLALEQFLAFCANRVVAPSVSLARDYVELTRLEHAPSPTRLQEWKAAMNQFAIRYAECFAVLSV